MSSITTAAPYSNNQLFRVHLFSLLEFIQSKKPVLREDLGAWQTSGCEVINELLTYGLKFPKQIGKTQTIVNYLREYNEQNVGEMYSIFYISHYIKHTNSKLDGYAFEFEMLTSKLLNEICSPKTILILDDLVDEQIHKICEMIYETNLERLPYLVTVK